VARLKDALRILALGWKIARALGVRRTFKVLGELKKIFKEARGMKKGWWLSKTVWFGVLNVAMSVAGMLSDDVAKFMSDNVVALQGVIGSIVVLLRSITGKTLTSDPS